MDLKRYHDPNDEKGVTFRVYTQEGDKQFSNQLYWYRGPQNATAFSSENIWLPLTSDRKLYVAYPGPGTKGHVDSEIVLLGYR